MELGGEEFEGAGSGEAEVERKNEKRAITSEEQTGDAEGGNGVELDVDEFESAGGGEKEV